jgi:cysteine desulfurase
MPVDLHGEWADVDALSFSAHKFHGPKGVGGLYLRPGIDLPPLLRGGAQEGGRRAGTTNTPALAGLAAAADGWDPASASAVRGLRDQFEAALLAHFPDVIIHSVNAPRLPNTSCFSLPNVVGEAMATKLASQGIIVGTGSACSSGAMHPPKTLLAMGVDYNIARAALRVSCSVNNKPEDLADFLEALMATQKLESLYV